MTPSPSLQIKPSQDSLSCFDTCSTTSSASSVSTVSEEMDDKVILYEISLAAIYKLPVTSVPKDYDCPPSIPSYLLDENDGSKSQSDSGTKNNNTITYQHLLVAKGKFQIFKMLGQSAAYFKCGQFIHPILPKMRMWRIMFSEFVLPQPSPGKYWRLKMFDISKESADLLEIILFECCYFQSMYTPPRQPLPPPLVESEIPEKNMIETEPRPIEIAAKDQENKIMYDILDSGYLLEKCSLDLLGFPLTPESPESCIDSDSTTETLANSVNGNTPLKPEFDFTRPDIQGDTTIVDSVGINNDMFSLTDKNFNSQFFAYNSKEVLEDFPYLSPTLTEINNSALKDNDVECAASTSSCSTLDLILDSFDDFPVHYPSSQVFSKERLIHYEQDLIFHKQLVSNPSNILVQIHHHHHHYYPESPSNMQHFSSNKACFKLPQNSWEPIAKTRGSRSFSDSLSNTSTLDEDTKFNVPVFSELQKEVPTANEVLSHLVTDKADVPMKFSVPSIGKRSNSFSASNLLEPFQFSILGSTVGLRNYSKTAATATNTTQFKNSTDSPLLGSWNNIVSKSLPWDKFNLNAIYKNTLANE